MNRNQVKTASHRLNIRFGDNIELLGFDLATAETQLRPGARMTVTMVYRRTGAQPPDLKRFVQLVGAGNEMAAQDDSIPQRGANPTWSWTPDEIILDEVTLKVSDHAVPGVYRLLIGFYGGDGVRAGSDRRWQPPAS
ncbi:MAG: hypothetical protein IPK16_21595 [Anaerolineales bacterium]|nr:hypothetical protein [Anaerolineales bacterium]